jgi:hypothetical protein
MSYEPYTLAPNPSGDLTGASDTAAIQAAINALPDGGTLLFPSPAPYYISATLQLYGACGRRLLSFGQPDTKPLGQRGTEFIWVGGAGFDSLLYVGSHRCAVEGIAFSFDKNATPPVCGLRIDGGTPASWPLNPVTVTGNSVCRCLFTAPAGTAGATATFYCLDVSRTAQTNCDINTVADCIFNGGAVGARFGSNSNCKANRLYGNQFNGCGYGVWMLAGSFACLDCVFQSCTVCDVANDDVCDYCVIETADSEGATLCARLRTSSVPVTIRNCRYSAIVGASYLDLVCAGFAARIEDTYFNGPTTSTLFTANSRTTAGIILDDVRCNGGTLGDDQQFGDIEIRGFSSGF